MWVKNELGAGGTLRNIHEGSGPMIQDTSQKQDPDIPLLPAESLPPSLNKVGAVGSIRHSAN